VFVKTPTLSPIKTRLACDIGEADALKFYQYSLLALEETLQKAKSDIAKQMSYCPKLFWAVGEKEGTAHPLWSKWDQIYTQGGDLGDRQCHVYQTLYKQFGKVILLGADAPQLSIDHIKDALKAFEKTDFVVGPAKDGGYYLLGGRKPIYKKQWKNIIWSTSQTRQMLLDQLNAPVSTLSMLSDVDHQKDLATMIEEMPLKPHFKQKTLIDWIKTKNWHISRSTA
ncbi:MAG: TIGR04282 family arsenosugar biosynthesis glycosyltransferase, partial [Pseudomonadota bacterium]